MLLVLDKSCLYVVEENKCINFQSFVLTSEIEHVFK